MKEKKKSGPQVRSSRVIIDRDLARRLDRFVMKSNRADVAKRLGVSPETLAAALAEGTMLAATRDRLVAALAIEETKGSAA